MPAFTENLNLYLAGGGSTGTITPDEVVDIDRLNENFRAIDSFAASVNAASADTGWIDISSANASFASGVTTGGTPGTLQYRIKNGTVYWRGGCNGTFPSGNYTLAVSGFPVEARPSSNGGPIRAGGGSSGASPVFVEISDSGNITVAHSTGSSRVWFAFAASYPQG